MLLYPLAALATVVLGAGLGSLPVGAVNVDAAGPGVQPQGHAVDDLWGPRWVVITSINAPTAPVRAFNAMPDWHVVVVGDVSSPPDPTGEWPSLRNTVFLDLEAQSRLPFLLSPQLPLRHYARKNLGGFKLTE
jgi:hypothetical protein